MKSEISVYLMVYTNAEIKEVQFSLHQPDGQH